MLFLLGEHCARANYAFKKTAFCLLLSRSRGPTENKSSSSLKRSTHMQQEGVASSFRRKLTKPVCLGAARTSLSTDQEAASLHHLGVSLQNHFVLAQLELLSLSLSLSLHRLLVILHFHGPFPPPTPPQSRADFLHKK